MLAHMCCLNKHIIQACTIDFDFCTDVYGLVLFLGVDPYWVKHWWDQLLYRPYRRGNTEPLYNVIAQLLWRSAKKDVLDQVEQDFFQGSLNKKLHLETIWLSCLTVAYKIVHFIPDSDSATDRGGTLVELLPG